MKRYAKQCFSFFIGCGLVLPTASFGDLGPLPNVPLFLSSNVDPNILFALDDSGSMDFESLVDANNGIPGFDTSAGTFFDNNGDFLLSGVDASYAYLFPNGIDDDTNYDGRRLLPNSQTGTGFAALPPVRAHAFARTAFFNGSYYDPEVVYTPWPEVAGTDLTFPDSDPVAALYDPILPFLPMGEIGEGVPSGVDTTLNLLADKTSDDDDTGTQFFVAENMACDNDGGTCEDGLKSFTYYPATYYRRIDDDSVEYTVGENSLVSSEFDVSNSVLIETESAELNAAGDWAVVTNDFPSQGDALERFQNNSTEDDGDLPVNNLEYTFNADGVVNGQARIWLRRRWIADENSLFFNAQRNEGGVFVDIPENELSIPSAVLDDNGFATSVDGIEFYFWVDTIAGNNPVYIWEEWATTELLGETRINVRPRESGAEIDQILITTNLDATPDGILVLAGSAIAADLEEEITFNCGANQPQNYDLFYTNAGDFNFPGNIDALGPDGSCLELVEIRPEINSYSTSRIEGQSTVTFAEESQNFANWFTYFRRRHQALRGGLGSALEGVQNVRAGLFWFQNQRTVEAFDFDEPDEKAEFFIDHYTHVFEGGTPLRQALLHAGNELNRSTTVGEAEPLIIAECQQNFALLFTDGFNTGTVNLPGSTDNFDSSDAFLAFASPDVQDVYSDTFSNTAGDIAAFFYATELRPDINTGSVPPPSECLDEEEEPSPLLDCNTDLHMNTFIAGLGSQGSFFNAPDAAGNVAFATVADAFDSGVVPPWPPVGGGSNGGTPFQVDDLYHAAVNGRGEFVNSDSGAGLGDALSAAVNTITGSAGTGSVVTFNTSSAEEGSLLFQGTFNPADWSGDLLAFQLDEDANIIGQEFSAATQLDLRDLGADPRRILTVNALEGTITKDGIEFSFDSLSADTTTPEFLADLNTAPDGSDDGLAEQRIAYLTGVDGDDFPFDQFRNRSSRLYDIINSGPVFVGAPSGPFPSLCPFGCDPDTGVVGTPADDPFIDFVNANEDREPVVYAGSNGGMLHGFDADATSSSAGREVLAFIPSTAYSTEPNEGLHYLTDPLYGHRFYVDLPAVGNNVYIPTNSEDGPLSWRSVLIGGGGAGGRGLFALDITEPEDFDTDSPEDIVLWEFTDQDDPGVGDMVSPPIVAMMNNNRWAAIFGNGFNAEADNGVGKLFIVFIDRGVDGEWTLSTSTQGGTTSFDDDTDYLFISTEFTEGTGDSEVGFGLAGVTVSDTDGDLVADRIYAGDLAGNLWVFDVTSDDVGDWEVAFSSNGANGGPQPLFQATDAAGTPQPITAPPNLTFNSATPNASDPNNLIAFGTGQYLIEGDPLDQSLQTFYVVHDDGDLIGDRDDLVERTLVEVTITVEDDPATTDVDESGTFESRAIAETAPVDFTQTDGYFFDFDLLPGERVVDGPIILNEFVLFNSIVPNETLCEGGGITLLTGLPIAEGITSEEGIIDITGNGVIDGGAISSINQGIGQSTPFSDMVFESDNLSTDINQRDIDVGAGANEGRLGWQELTP